MPSSVDCSCHKNFFPYPISLLRILEKKIYNHSYDLLQVVCWLVWCEPCQIIQVKWMSMKEAVFFCNRMVHGLFPSPPFCNRKTIWRRWNESSFYLCFSLLFICSFVLFLPFILWKSVEHNQLLFHLAPPCFFSLTLILRTLLNFLYFFSLRLDYKKGYINSGLTHFIKTFVVAMEIY